MHASKLRLLLATSAFVLMSALLHAIPPFTFTFHPFKVTVPANSTISTEVLVQLTDILDPNATLDGVVLTFHVPSSGPSAILSVTSSPLDDGLAAYFSFKPNGIAGPYEIVAQLNGEQVGKMQVFNALPGTQPGEQLVNISAGDHNGDVRSLREFLRDSNSYLVLDVCANWCVPCGFEQIEAAKARLALASVGIRLHYVPIMIDGQTPGVPSIQGDALEWANGFPNADPVLHTGGSYTSDIGNFCITVLGVEKVLATYLIVAPDGTIFRRRAGFVTWSAQELINDIAARAGVAPPAPATLPSYLPPTQNIFVGVGGSSYSGTGTPGLDTMINGQRLVLLSQIAPTRVEESHRLRFDRSTAFGPIATSFAATVTGTRTDGLRRFLAHPTHVLARGLDNQGTELWVYDLNFLATVTFTSGTTLTVIFDVTALRSALATALANGTADGVMHTPTQVTTILSQFKSVEVPMLLNIEFAPVPLITVADVTVNENSSSAILTFTRSTGAGADADFNLATSPSSATAGNDYTSVSTKVVVPYDRASMQVNIPIIDDTLPEATEQFSALLSAPRNAMLTRSSASVSIRDNDIIASVADIRVPEGNSGISTALVPVTLNTPAKMPVSFAWKASPGTASSADFVVNSGELTIPIGASSVMIPVGIRGDTVIETAETFSITIGSMTGAVVEKGLGAVTIVDDDKDTMPPVIDPKGDVVLTTLIVAPIAVQFTPPNARDNFDGSVPVTCTPPSGTKFFYGTFPITCTAVDKAGNLATSTFNVIVQRPVITGAIFDQTGVKLTTVHLGQHVVVQVNPGAFPAHETIDISIRDATGVETKLRSVPAKADGSIDADLIIPRNISFGSAEIRAQHVAKDGTETNRAWVVIVKP